MATPQATWRDRGEIRRIEGRSLFVIDTGGDTETLVVLHGYPTSSHDFHDVLGKAEQEEGKWQFPDVLASEESGLSEPENVLATEQAVRWGMQRLGETGAASLLATYRPASEPEVEKKWKSVRSQLDRTSSWVVEDFKEVPDVARIHPDPVAPHEARVNGW